jgi:FtsP/CotA-like multicopper oxidase with cupredoxin domain
MFVVIGAVALGLQVQVAAPPPRLPLPKPAPGAIRVSNHGNTRPAGSLNGKVLTVSLEVVTGAWRPEGDTDPEVPILAFAEAGKGPVNPGPLIRVRQGTEIHLTITNRTDSSLVINGLRPAVSTGTDSVHLPPQSMRELSYRLDTPGTYFYAGWFAGSAFSDRLWLDSQLNGAIVVDAPGAVRADRIFVLSEWFHPYDDNRPFEDASVINGKGWPYTDRIQLQQGDSTRFRIINAIPLWHPMHLHGFFYRVVARGMWNKDGPIPDLMRPLVNTDLLQPAGTLTFDFAPTTPGNWLLHCHFSFHMDETVTLSGSPPDSASMNAHAGHAAADSGAHRMRGLVVGIQVAPARGHNEYRATNPREIRLLAQKDSRRLINQATAYGFVLQRGDTVPARDSVQLPGPVLELVRGQPVRITVVNNLDEPTGIHWHGLEIPSFPDGVPDWSGMGNRIFRSIAPRDSFVAEFTPPRSGTFPYHSHLNERHQINSGMYGAIIVSDQPRDPKRDHVIVAGGGGLPLQPKTESYFALVNGLRFPPPLTLEAGITHRLRLVSIHPDWRIAFTLRNDSTIARWRAVAKDGAEMPAIQATERAANVEMGPGETADFEFRALMPGKWRLEVKSVESGWYIPLEIIVVAPAAPPPD